MFQVGHINLPFWCVQRNIRLENTAAKICETQSVALRSNAWCDPDARFIWTKKNVTSDCPKNWLTVSISLGCRDLRRKRWRDEIFIVLSRHAVGAMIHKINYFIRAHHRNFRKRPDRNLICRSVHRPVIGIKIQCSVSISAIEKFASNFRIANPICRWKRTMQRLLPTRLRTTKKKRQ